MIHWHAHSLFFFISLGLYALSGLAFLAVRRTRRWGEALLVLAWLANTILIVGAWVRLGQPPFQTLYQSLVFFSWAVALVYLFLRLVAPLSRMGGVAAACALAAMVFAFFKADPGAGMLPPALRSPWFVPHVMAYFIGYGALFFSFACALMFLVMPGMREKTLGADLLRFMDGAIRGGFLLISIGLAIGIVWAEAAWAAYWSWDPKENWALVTWLVYLAYLHLRNRPRWRGKAAAWLAVAGFLAVLFTYLGVNYLPTITGALHAYQ